MFSVHDLLERVSQSRAIGRLHAFFEEAVGDVFVEDGRAVFARAGQIVGADAAHEILSWPAARWQWLPAVRPSHPHMNLAIAAILLDHRIRHDERGGFSSARLTTPIPDLRRASLAGPSPTADVWRADFGTAAEPVVLEKEGCIVGRDDTCDIAISHRSISRRHCILRVTHRGLHLLDLNSTNGTYLSGQKIDEVLLTGGEQVLLGDVTVRFHRTPAAAHLGVRTATETPVSATTSAPEPSLP
jgi:FHA domain